MADSKAPPSAAASSNPLPEPKRVRTSFPDTQAGDQRSPPRHSIGATESQAPGIATTASAIPTEPLPEDGEIEADDDSVADSAFGGGNANSETTSITSEVYKGYMENGRRYASGRDENYYCPSDEKQFEVFYNTHLIYLILDSQRRNPLFQSPLDENAQNVLDLGTGDGTWVMDVADKMPHLTVRGIDLFPPPQNAVAPNCILEVDDMLKPWTFETPFDLIHLRFMMGACTPEEWRKLYHQCYKNLKPGGWIEQLEIEIHVSCDDGTMPPDSLLANVGKTIEECALNSGKPLDTIHTFRSSIEKAGFVNVQETKYKVPIGSWPKHPVYKDAGTVATAQFKGGLEGWIMFFLTRFAPKPWTAEEVLVYVAKMRQEVDRNWHVYQHAKRVWAQKPYDTEKVEPEVEVESLT